MMERHSGFVEGRKSVWSVVRGRPSMWQRWRLRWPLLLLASLLLYLYISIYQYTLALTILSVLFNPFDAMRCSLGKIRPNDSVVVKKEVH